MLFLTIGVVSAHAQNFGPIDPEVQTEEEIIRSLSAQPAVAGPEIPGEETAAPASHDYLLGVNDILEVSILQPDEIQNTVTVAPDGSIAVPYIGSVFVKGHTLTQVQEEIQQRLADGYMKYPVVAVALKESRSQKFFVYGEVLKPGAYPVEENMTVLGAISMASGFSKFGSASRVKVLRPRKNQPGFEVIKVNMNAIMSGRAKEDIVVSPGDIIVVSEGLF